MAEPTTGARAGSPAPPDLLDRAAASLFAAIGAWSWAGIALAELGWFHPAALLGVATPAALASAAAAWRALGAAARPPVLAAVLLAAVLAVAAALAARPAEYLVDGSDGSVYLGIGRTLARHHSLTPAHPALDALPAEEWEAVLGRERNPPRVFNLFPGGMQVYPGVNQVRPNFFHLLPVWVASAESLAGARAAYFVTPMFGVLAVAAMWLLARAFSSPLPATLAALLLSANAGQLWFSRVPTAEMMTQALALFGLYFLVRCYQQPLPVFGALGGLAFGLAAMTRIDVLMFVTPLVVGFLILLAVEGRWTRSWTWCALALAATTGHAIAHAWLVSTPYTERIVFHLRHGRTVSLASRVVPPLVLLAGAFALLLARTGRLPAVAAKTTSALFVLALAGALARMWPELTGGYVALLLTTPGLALAALGLTAWMLADRTAPALLVAGMLLISTLVYGESVRDVGEAPMVLRRLVPVILPLAALSIGLLAHHAGRLGRAWAGAAAIAALAVGGLWAAAARPLATPVMQGVHDQMARIAESLPAGALVITDKTTPSHFGLSLQTAFGVDVLWARHAPGTTAAIARLAGLERPVFAALGRGPGDPTALTAIDFAGVALGPPRVETLAFVDVEPAADRLPGAMAERAYTIDIYPLSARPPGGVPFTVEIGEADAGARVDGFHLAERMGDASARWAQASARVQLPAFAQPGPTTLVLRLAAPRPPAIAPPVVRLDLDGCDAGVTPPLAAGFTVVEVPVAAACAARLVGAPSVLTLRADTFVPAEHGMGDDTRALGVAVDWVRLERR